MITLRMIKTRSLILMTAVSAIPIQRDTIHLARPKTLRFQKLVIVIDKPRVLPLMMSLREAHVQ